MSFSLDSYGKVVCFDVYPVGHLGDIYKNVEILAILDYDTAKQFRDIAATAVAVYPTLPQGTPKDYTKYKYLKLKHSDGAISVVALDWVNSSTVKEHKSVEIHVKLVASGIDSVERVRAVLQSNNFDVKEISLK